MTTPTARSGSRKPAHEDAEHEEVTLVPIMSILPGESPRQNGEDKAHIARLAETEAELPPILVHQPTMTVIDGMHRLMAASLKGQTTIKVRFINGNQADVFLWAVRENVTHGLPLSQADRRAAAERIIGTHPHLSDRAIGEAAGLAAKTVAGIRRSSGEASESSARIGKDGRVRPVNGEEGRLRAAEILASQPDASLREVAKAAGISPATVLDVRNRLARGEPPAPIAARPEKPVSAQVQPPQRGQLPAPAATVERLMKDPSLRDTDSGRQLLRLLHATAAGADQLPELTARIPPHCVLRVAQLARQFAQIYQDLASELNRRDRIIDPSARRDRHDDGCAVVQSWSP